MMNRNTEDGNRRMIPIDTVNLAGTPLFGWSSGHISRVLQNKSEKSFRQSCVSLSLHRLRWLRFHISETDHEQFPSLSFPPVAINFHSRLWLFLSVLHHLLQLTRFMTASVVILSVPIMLATCGKMTNLPGYGGERIRYSAFPLGPKTTWELK
jgi:hypothetical protein